MASNLPVFQENLHSSDSEDDEYVPDPREVSSNDSDDEDPLPPDKKDEIETKINAKKNFNVFDSEDERNKLFTVPSSSECKRAEKQRANDLFKSFLEEVDSEMKVKNPSISAENITESSVVQSFDSSIKSNGHASGENTSQKTYELFDFAGETVSVIDGTKIISDDKSADVDFEKSNTVKNKSDAVSQSLVVKRKGLQSVLGTVMNKKKKLTILEKSSLDWNSFKTEQGISEELKKFNKGRGGYIERKRFLERSSIKSFEIEHELRFSRRKNNS